MGNSAINVGSLLTPGPDLTFDAAQIATGQVALARGGTGVDISGSGSSTAVLAQDAAHAVTVRSLVAADIPSLAASKLTSGQVALARGGTNADMSGTGGANQIVRQNSVGGAMSASVLASADFGTTNTPQFARLGLGQAADSTAVMAATGQYLSAKVTDTVSALAWTTDWNGGNVHYVVLANGTNVVTLSNPKDGGRYTIMLRQPASGTGLVTWPAAVLWPSGTAPTLTAAINKTDVISLVYDGTNSKYYAQAGLNF